MADGARLIADIEREMAATAYLTGCGRLSDRVRAALLAVPRDRFVPETERSRAYDNAALSIGGGQTISQPFVVALMTQVLNVGARDRVLEVGTGSGYQTAVLAHLAGMLYTVEVIPELAHRARTTLAALGITNVRARMGDGRLGWPEAAPFDAAIVTAAPAAVPSALVGQLRPGGRLVLPLGPATGEQELVRIDKDAAGNVTRRTLLPVAFVPLTGGDGR